MATAPDPKVDPTRVDPTRARRTGEKSAEAFRTISEVAQELDLPQHVLRFWETKFPQVKPMKRGGGRRYYRPDDILLLKRIRALLYDQGYTIKGARKLLKDKTAAEAVEVDPVPNVTAEAPQAALATEAAPSGTPDPARAAPPAAPHGIGEAEREQLRAVLGELEEIRALLKQGSSD